MRKTKTKISPLPGGWQKNTTTQNGSIERERGLPPLWGKNGSWLFTFIPSTIQKSIGISTMQFEPRNRRTRQRLDITLFTFSSLTPSKLSTLANLKRKDVSLATAESTVTSAKMSSTKGYALALSPPPRWDGTPALEDLETSRALRLSHAPEQTSLCILNSGSPRGKH